MEDIQPQEEEDQQEEELKKAAAQADFLTQEDKPTPIEAEQWRLLADALWPPDLRSAVPSQMLASEEGIVGYMRERQFIHPDGEPMTVTLQYDSPESDIPVNYTFSHKEHNINVAGDVVTYTRGDDPVPRIEPTLPVLLQIFTFLPS